METTIYRLDSRDFTEMEQALSAWDHRYRQISPGAFHGSLLHAQVGSLGVFRNRWERAVQYRGTSPRGTVALAVTLAQSGEGRWMGQRMGPDDMLVAGCGAEGDYRSAPLWDSVVFAIPEAALLQQIADITHDDPRDFCIHGIVRLTPQVAAQVRQAAMTYLGAAARSLLEPDAPSPLSALAQLTIELMARALVSAQPPRTRKSSLDRQRQLIRKAEDFCAYRTDQPLRIGELCRGIGVSDRTLRDTFHKLTGMSPLAYLKIERLNLAYRALLGAGPAEVLIKRVAYAVGFTHLGHFTRDYKQLFGELPSETLQRCEPGNRFHV